MIKIFPVEAIRKADAYTIENEPISSIDLMERAASSCIDWLDTRLFLDKPVFYIYCGPGNNGGDGLAIARMLTDKGYTVHIAVPGESTEYSTDARLNLERLKEKGIATSGYDEALKWTPASEDVAIDALFGSGLSRSVGGNYKELIVGFNRLNCIKIAIDIPSGLFADKAISKGDAVVKADYTLSFQFPKLAFFFPENDEYIGEWSILPIGLDESFIESEPSTHYFLDKYSIHKLLRPRNKFSHKGTFGHALLISGSLGKMGAAILSSRAGLRSGCGLLSAHVPRCGYEIMQVSVPEAMISIDKEHDSCSGIPDLSPYSAIGAGPGMGQSKEAGNCIKLLLQEAKVPLVLDADAINILADQKTWQAFIPAGTILTPHPKEFERLAGRTSSWSDRLQLLKEYCIKQKVYIILKGSYSIVCTPAGHCYFNSTGNPGMATAGSGDTLTGIILGLLAQQYTPGDACLLGMYLHGLAGDLAKDKTGKEALLASDIVDSIGAAYLDLHDYWE
ncbi:MAG: NAD(P)H-hydrate dehydratase [Bacteroidales bacterium]|nr:NAD(P)H-hydrate dehydratase [Bacteroidales bacterium]